MPIKVLYIDDVDSEQLAYAELLKKEKEIEVKISQPPPSVDDLSTILGSPTDIFLIDYELTCPTSTGVHANYRGGTLASALRERIAEFPMIMFTRKNLMSTSTQTKHLLESVTSFDGVLLKDDVDTNPDKAALYLKIIAEGFICLRESERSWENARSLLDIKSDFEENLIREASPPIIKGSWQVREMARWIQGTLLKYPGILYDSLHAATLLGITEESYLEIQDYFKECSYKGCFASNDLFWWKDRLIDKATTLQMETDENGPIFTHFVIAYEKKYGISLHRSKCIYCEKIPADRVCYVLHKPVMTSCSISYRPDNRPSTMDEARVSFKAILETNEVDETFLDPSSNEIVKGLREGAANID